jgi:hypothetical protein
MGRPARKALRQTTSDVVEAMERFGENIALKTAAQNQLGNDRAVRRGSGVTPEFLN